MKSLTEKEEELMTIFWERGPLFVKEIVELYPEPKPHVNTVSTFVRLLEQKGYVSHTSFGSTYQYYAVISKEDYSRNTLKSVISKYFDNSLKGVVSALFKDEKLTDDEISELINQVKKNNKSSKEK